MQSSVHEVNTRTTNRLNAGLERPNDEHQESFFRLAFLGSAIEVNKLIAMAKSVADFFRKLGRCEEATRRKRSNADLAASRRAEKRAGKDRYPYIFLESDNYEARMWRGRHHGFASIVPGMDRIGQASLTELRDHIGDWVEDCFEWAFNTRPSDGEVPPFLMDSVLTRREGGCQ